MKNFNWFHFVLFAVTGLLLFCCLRVPVNAAEGETFSYSVNVSGKRTNHSGNYVTFKVTFEGTFDYPVAGVANSSSGHTAAVYYYNGSSLCSAYLTCTSYVVIENTGVTNGDKLYTVGNTSDYIPITDTWHDFSSHDVESYYICTTSIPVFSSVDDAINYFQTGDTTQQINKPVDTLVDDAADGLSFYDTKLYRDDIKLRGFMSDYGVNASWSQFSIGDSFQSFIDKGHYLLNRKAVFVEFTYAYVAAPGQVAYTKYLPSAIDGESLSCYINYNDYVSADDSVFLRAINFYPAVQLLYFPYGESEGVSTWYYGSANRVTFNSDGTSNSVVSDAGNSQNTHYEYTDSPSSNISGVAGALDSFSGLLDSLYGSISRVAKFATVVFSWLPWWASLLIGAAVVVCFILRIAGR